MSIYVSQRGVARAVEKVYIGVRGVARELESIYVGVRGIARVVFKRFSFAKYRGTVEGLGTKRYRHAAASVGRYAVFVGGYLGNYSVTAAVEAYDDTLTKSAADNLPTAKDCICGASIGNYALFAGGSTYRLDVNVFNTWWAFDAYKTVDVYDQNLVHSTATDMPFTKRLLSAGNVGNYAVFAGGVNSVECSSACAYNAALTMMTCPNLSVARNSLAAASVGGYILFAGGKAKNAYQATVDAYDQNLTMLSLGELGTARSNLAGASTKQYALFGGGTTGSAVSNVDVYSASLTRYETSTALIFPAYDLSGLSVKDHAVFAGGQNGSADVYAVNIFDKNLTITRADDLTEAHASDVRQSAAFAGKYAVFAGGSNYKSALCTGADAYEI